MTFRDLTANKVADLDNRLRPYTGCMRHMWTDDMDEFCPICADEIEQLIIEAEKDEL
jgi:hypothetical protein